MDTNQSSTDVFLDDIFSAYVDTNKTNIEVFSMLLNAYMDTNRSVMDIYWLTYSVPMWT